MTFTPTFIGNTPTLKMYVLSSAYPVYIVQNGSYVVRSKHCIHSRLITFAEILFVFLLKRWLV